MQGWYYAFAIAVSFILIPSILLAILEYNFLFKVFSRTAVSWKGVMIRTLLNVPFHLTVIWYHIQMTYSNLTLWLNFLRFV